MKTLLAAAFALLALGACSSSSGGGGNPTNLGSTPATFLYAPTLSGNSIWQWQLNTTAPMLTTQAAAVPAGAGNIQSMAIHPSKKFVYAFTLAPSTSITIFTVDSTTGNLTKSSTVFTPGVSSPEYGIFSSDGKFMYAFSAAANLVYGYSVDTATGNLTSLSGSPVNTGVGVEIGNLVLSPDGGFLLFPDYGTNTLKVYTRDTTTGALTFLSSTALAGTGNSLALNATGTAGVVALGSNTHLGSFTFNQTTGAVGSLQYLTTTENAVYAVSDNSNHVFVVSLNPTSYMISYAVDGSTAALTQISSAVNLVTNAQAPAIDPTGRFLAVSESTSNEIRLISIDSGGDIGLAGAITLPASTYPLGAAFLQLP